MSYTALLVQKNMTTEQKLMFQSQYQNERKDPTVALLLNLFGLHYFYLGYAGKGVLMWISFLFFVGFLWAFIDLFRVKSMTEAYNDKKARELAAFITGSA